MGLRLKNSSGNYVELNAPSSIATDFGLTLPVNDGNASQYLQTDGAGTLSWQTVSDNISWTEGASTSLSGTSTSISGIPDNAKRIIVMFENESNSGDYALQLRVGTGSTVETTGYVTTSGYQSGSSDNTVNYTTSFQLEGSGTSNLQGFFEFIKGNGNFYYMHGFANKPSNATLYFYCGSIELSGELNIVQLRPSAGTGFSAGEMYVRYLTQS
jgi:hypothetical protein